MSATLPRITAEHLLSAVMRKHYQAARNLEFHLGAKKTKCDYAVASPLTERDIEQIEELVNKQIARDLPVGASIVERAAAGEYDLWKVPPEADTIRIVRIGEYDSQPCRGEHVASTAEIGAFRIASFETRENGRTRIRFRVEEAPE